MKEWIIFSLFMIVGIGMLSAGVFYTRKEKEDPESVKIYRFVTIIGGLLAVFAVLVKFI